MGVLAASCAVPLIIEQSREAPGREFSVGAKKPSQIGPISLDGCKLALLRPGVPLEGECGSIPLIQIRLPGTRRHPSGSLPDSPPVRHSLPISGHNANDEGCSS